MKYIELQAAFELEIDQLDDNLTKPTTSDIEYWLMAGLDKFMCIRDRLLDSAKFAWKDDKKYLNYIFDEGTRTFLRMDDSWSYEDFDIFVMSIQCIYCFLFSIKCINILWIFTLLIDYLLQLLRFLVPVLHSHFLLYYQLNQIHPVSYTHL